MAKFALVFVMAVLALQGSNAASLRQQSNRPEFEILEDIYQKVRDIAKEVFEKLPPIFENMMTEVDTILSEADIPSTMAKVMESMKQAEDSAISSGDDFQECSTLAKRELISLDEYSRNLVCRVQSEEALAPLRERLEALVRTATQLVATVNKDVAMCMVQNGLDSEEFFKCLSQRMELVREQLDDLQKQVAEALQETENAAQAAIADVPKCVEDFKKDITNKGEAIVEDFNKCVQEMKQPSKSYTRRGFTNVFDFVKNLMEKIEDESSQITVNLPEELNNFSDKINIIVSNVNLEVLIIELKEQIDAILSSSGIQDTTCGADAHQKVDALAKEGQNASEMCVSETQLVADNLDRMIKSLLEKVRMMGEKMSEFVLECANKNTLGFGDYAQCLEERVESIREEVTQLQTEVRQTIKLALETSQEAIEKLGKCMKKVVDETEEKGKLILEDTKKCLKI